MEPWELTDKEIHRMGQAVPGCQGRTDREIDRLIDRVIATSAGQKARAVTAWEIYDYLLLHGIPCQSDKFMFEKWLELEGIKRED